MKVYIVILGVKYEGEDIEGVFGTRESAEAKVEALKVDRVYRWASDKTWTPDGDGWNHQDLYLTIQEWDVE